MVLAPNVVHQGEGCSVFTPLIQFNNYIFLPVVLLLFHIHSQISVLLTGGPHVVQKTLRQSTKHRPQGGYREFPRVHPILQNTGKHPHEGDPSPRPCPLPHHHERPRLPGKTVATSELFLISLDSRVRWVRRSVRHQQSHSRDFRVQPMKP